MMWPEIPAWAVREPDCTCVWPLADVQDQEPDCPVHGEEP